MVILCILCSTKCLNPHGHIVIAHKLVLQLLLGQALDRSNSVESQLWSIAINILFGQIYLVRELPESLGNMPVLCS